MQSDGMGIYENVRKFPIHLDNLNDGNYLIVQLSFYPNGTIENRSEYMGLGIKLTEGPNTKNIKRFYLDYEFNLDYKYAKYAKSLELQTNYDNGRFFQRYFEFIKKDKADLLKNTFHFKISIHSIKYSKKSKRSKRPSISNLSISQISEENATRNSDNHDDDIDYKALYNQAMEENAKLKLQNAKLRRKNEQFRFALHSLKNLCEKFPSVNLAKIKWAKPDKRSHCTVRSQQVHQIKEHIQSQPKYERMIQQNKYLIEENPTREGYPSEYTQSELYKIKKYFKQNREGNSNPIVVTLKKNLNEVIKTRRIKQCGWQNSLNGDMETFAVCDINKGVILGQYIGDEMLKEEYEKMYNFTMEEAVHSRYLHGETLFVPNDLAMGPPKRKKRKKNMESKGEVIEIYIDAFKEEQNALNVINDCRANISLEELREDDRDRANCEFVSVLVNGWPSILVRTTKKIKMNESLLICYGANYHLVMETNASIKDAHNKFDVQVANILATIDHDLGDPNQFELE